MTPAATAAPAVSPQVRDAAPGVPVLVLPRAAVAPATLPAPVARHWWELHDQVRLLAGELSAPTGTPGRTGPRWAATVDAGARLCAGLAPLGAVPGAAGLPAPVPVHSDYFRVRHHELTPAQQAAEVAGAVHRALADLRTAPLDVNDTVAELDAVALLLAVLRPRPGTGPAPAPGPSPVEPGPDPMDRWLVAHHLYFLLNVHAAGELESAARTVARRPGRGPGGTGAATMTGRAATFVRGFTAAMLHSCAMPAAAYTRIVRPTMSPPHVPIELTGVMQVEHRRYRAAVDALLDALPQPHHELERVAPQLARARDRLLEADLLDLERHVTVAAVLVGAGHSLVQRGTSPTNATAALRRMRHRRARAYRDVLSHGDVWLDPLGAGAAGTR